MFGSSSINVLRGAGHFSSIVEHTTEKGRYDLSIGIFNFPIPSVNTLCTIATGYPSYVSVGFIKVLTWHRKRHEKVSSMS